jgi:hypothetical protein
MHVSDLQSDLQLVLLQLEKLIVTGKLPVWWSPVGFVVPPNSEVQLTLQALVVKPSAFLLVVVVHLGDGRVRQVQPNDELEPFRMVGLDDTLRERETDVTLGVRKGSKRGRTSIMVRVQNSSWGSRFSDLGGRGGSDENTLGSLTM